ncbi:hypothetical protein V8C34DRAFT_288384 [Trichoderma compactum]
MLGFRASDETMNSFFRSFLGTKTPPLGAYLPLDQPSTSISKTHSNYRIWEILNNNKLIILLSTLCITLVTDRYIGFLEPRHQSDKPIQLSQQKLPQIPTHLVTFRENKAFMDAVPGDLNQPWETIVPNGRGFIKVTEPATWNLTGGFPLEGVTPYSEQYCISMFHQLHCLATLKTAFAKLLRREQKQAQSPGEGAHDHNNDEVEQSDNHLDHLTDASHLDHCFDYLRQAIMCAGDMTLEKAHIINGVPADAVDGWEVEHQCRDWSTMFDFAAKNRVKSTNGILNHGE